VRNRNTGYQRLDFTYRRLHGSNLDTGAYSLRSHPLALSTRFCYYNLNAIGTVAQDTLVALVLQNPTAPTPDTLRATLSFGREGT